MNNAVTITDFINVHNYLVQLKNPTTEMQEALKIVETKLLNCVKSIQQFTTKEIS